MTIPHLIGNPLEEVTAKQLNTADIYVLGVKDPQSPMQSLYCINKESLFSGAFIDLDINEDIFNNPTFTTSYQDILPNTFKGVPDLTKIGVTTYKDYWTVDFRRNPNLSEEVDGVQFITTLTGIKFMRYGKKGIFTPWQLMDSVIGTIRYMITSNDVAGLNYMGYLPITGMTYAKDQYPALYEILKNKVVSDATTFTLPDARGCYVASSSDKAGKTEEWTLPDLTDTIDFVKGTTKDKSLFKSMVEVNKLFTVKGKDDSITTMSYLDDNVIKEINNGNPVVGDDSGLTSELKFNIVNKIGVSHVGTKVTPDTLYTSGIYIYAGYPQI